jgi:hypothetical protein
MPLSLAQKSGRQVRSSMANGSSAEDAARGLASAVFRVPPGEIVNL